MDRSQTRVAVNRLTYYTDQSNAYSTEISRTQFWLTVSAAFQRIAAEAILTAVTMGAAAHLTRALSTGWASNSALAAWLGRGTANGGSAAVRFLAATGQASARATASGLPSVIMFEAAANTTARIGATMLIQQPIRLAAGDFTWKGLGLGLLGALVGRPGAPTGPTFNRLQSVLQRACNVTMPSAGIASYQGALVNLSLLAKGYNDFERTARAGNRDVLALKELLNAEGKDATDVLNSLAAVSAAKVYDLAHRHEREVVAGAEKLAGSVNYRAQVPFLAHHFSGITAELRDISVAYAGAEAGRQLWMNVLSFRRNAQHAVFQTSRLLQLSAQERAQLKQAALQSAGFNVEEGGQRAYHPPGAGGRIPE